MRRWRLGEDSDSRTSQSDIHVAGNVNAKTHSKESVGEGAVLNGMGRELDGCKIKAS